MTKKKMRFIRPHYPNEFEMMIMLKHDLYAGNWLVLMDKDDELVIIRRDDNNVRMVIEK